MFAIVQKQKYYLGKKVNGFLDVSGSRLALVLGWNVFTPKIKARKIINNVFINWGLSSIPWLEGRTDCSIVNPIETVKKSSNKLKSFISFKEKGVNIPKFFTNKEEVLALFDADPKTIIFCRTLLSGHSGKGIVVARNKEEVVDAPLYTLYIKKQFEYRVHVVFGEVVHIQQKRRLTTEQLEQRGIVERNPLIRNLDNGYIYSNNIDHEYLEGVEEAIGTQLVIQSKLAVDAIGLDFGAVDLVVDKYQDVHVLEVNSAPGIEGTTLEKYALAFKNKFGLGD